MQTTGLQFIKFGVVGLSNTFISYAIYSIFVYLGVYYILASVIAFVISVLNSFFWNNKYVFKNENNRKGILKSLLKTFVAYSLTGLILANFLLYIFVDILLISKYLAPLFGLVITVPLNFLLNKFWAFKTNNKEKNDEKN
jgi:putative flippase GtrA